MNQAPKKIYTLFQAKSKAEHYCAFQERSQQEVRERLYKWGLHMSEIEQVISLLIEDNFLNEERFAKAYVSGKFNIKGWGRIKIKQGLKIKQVSKPIIDSAIKTIDASDYFQKLEQVLIKKEQLIKEADLFKKKNKLAQFALSRGFEIQLIWEVIENLETKET